MFGKFKEKMKMMAKAKEMMKDDDVRALLEHPKFQDLMKDEEFQALAKAQDMQGIATHPKMMAVMQDPELSKLIQKAGPKAFGQMGGFPG